MNNRFSALQSFDDDLEFDQPAPAPAPTQEAVVEADAPPLAPEEIPEEVKNKKPVSVHEIGEGEMTPAKQKILDAKIKLHRQMLEEFNLVALEELSREELVRRNTEICFRLRCKGTFTSQQCRTRSVRRYSC